MKKKINKNLTGEHNINNNNLLHLNSGQKCPKVPKKIRIYRLKRFICFLKHSFKTVTILSSFDEVNMDDCMVIQTTLQGRQCRQNLHVR